MVRVGAASAVGEPSVRDKLGGHASGTGRPSFTSSWRGHPRTVRGNEMASGSGRSPTLARHFLSCNCLAASPRRDDVKHGMTGCQFLAMTGQRPGRREPVTLHGDLLILKALHLVLGPRHCLIEAGVPEQVPSLSPSARPCDPQRRCTENHTEASAPPHRAPVRLVHSLHVHAPCLFSRLRAVATDDHGWPQISSISMPKFSRQSNSRVSGELIR